jgi:hypothetical protein
MEQTVRRSQEMREEDFEACAILNCIFHEDMKKKKKTWRGDRL